MNMNRRATPAPTHAGSPSEACFMVLCGLLHPQHGDVGAVACAIMHRLLPTLLGAGSEAPPGCKKGTAQEGSGRRSVALDFVLAVHRCAGAARWGGGVGEL